MSDGVDRLAAALADRYTIEHELGAGGMATVYLAHDVKHDRKVALKVLRPELAAVIGADRFLAEIKTTANLQHPHILALHDSGEVNGTVFYVMPFVEGESLRDRLNRETQLPVRDAVRIAVEVAGALDYAHRKHVVHRDIKPENILLHDGRAMVADFGIALAASSAGSERMTETGMSLGTPHYMSPEQAMGERDLDARSDIYALGCVLHEMLAGEPPFTGPNAQSIVAKVMADDPTPIGNVRRTVPPHIEDAILTALQKLPADRFTNAVEFISAVEDEGAPARARRGRARRAAVPAHTRFAWPAAAVLAGLAVWGWLRPVANGVESLPSHLAVVVPNLGGASTALQRQLALSPDGRMLLYTAIASTEPDGTGSTNITMRRFIDETESSPVPGVEPFVSSYAVSQDGLEFIATIGGGAQQMFRYGVDGGSPRVFPSEIGWTSWVAWDSQGNVWFTDVSTPDRGVGRIDRAGNLTYPVSFDGPGIAMQQILPGDRMALVIRAPQGTSSGPAMVLDLETGQTDMLIDLGIVSIGYTAGHLVYVLQDASMEAVAFDVDGLRLIGRPVTVAREVSLTGSGVAQFAVAMNGTVAYIPEAPRSLVFVDRDGASRPATPEGRNFHAPTFSPDGRRVAVDFNAIDGRDVWILSVDDKVLTRATFDRDGHDATWAPDGQTFLYTSAPDGRVGTYRTRPGSAERELVFTSPELAYTGEWLNDMSAIVTAASSLGGGSFGDIGIIRDGGRGPLEPLVASRFAEQYPAISPNNRWVAYGSERSGRSEVYVRALTGGDPIQVSTGGGIEPVWRPDGRELFYLTGAGLGAEMVAATVATDPEFRVVSRQVLFSAADVATATPHANYDVSPDGETFVMVRFNPSSRIMVIQNLPALVRKLGGGDSE